MYSMICATSSALECQTASLSTSRAKMPNQISTWFSHEA